MGRYRDTRVTKEKQDKLLRDFCEVLSELRTSELMFRFLSDLLNRPERLMIARRLHIATLLESGHTYREIESMIGASGPTVARVHRWLEFGRKGYKRAVKEFLRKQRSKSSTIASYYR